MIDNSAFALTEEELTRYNQWAEGISVAMVNAEIESWTLEVNFSFWNLGKSIEARCGSNVLVIRDDL